MSHRSPARFLAPLALLAACATVYLIVHAGLREISDTSNSAGTTASSATTAKPAAKSKRSKKRAKTYTVKSGDVLGKIATRTGVSVDDLLKANDLDAADPLRVGQKLKLSP